MNRLTYLLVFLVNMSFLGCKSAARHPSQDGLASASDRDVQITESSTSFQLHLINKEASHLEATIEQQEANCTLLKTDQDWTPEAIMAGLYHMRDAAGSYDFLQKAGEKALRRAYFISVHQDSTVNRSCQRELTALIDAWTYVPPDCLFFLESCPYIDLTRPKPETSEFPFEFHAFLRDMIRSAILLEKNTSSSAAKEKAELIRRFKVWSDEALALTADNIDLSKAPLAFKMASLETEFLQGILTQDRKRMSEVGHAFGATLRSIGPQGEICPDFFIDKYYPQLFLGHALHLAKLLETYAPTALTDPDGPTRTGSFETCLSQKSADDGQNAFLTYHRMVGLPDENSSCPVPREVEACFYEAKDEAPPSRPLGTMERAIFYTAASNRSSLPPAGYSHLLGTESNSRWEPFYHAEIWDIASQYLAQKGLEVPKSVSCMRLAQGLWDVCRRRSLKMKGEAYPRIAASLKI